MSRICEICDGEQHTPEDHPFLPTMKEHHNPLDIAFGHEVQEKNMNVKDIDEGGPGSGRNPEEAPDVGGGGGGPLVSFETVGKIIHETVAKQLMDEKLNCQCKNQLK